MDNLIAEITKWSNVYEFAFQFWGPGNNNLHICKGGIELAIFGGSETPTEAMEKAIGWCKKQNPKGYKEPLAGYDRCIECGCKVALGNEICGECACEDDCDYL